MLDSKTYVENMLKTGPAPSSSYNKKMKVKDFEKIRFIKKSSYARLFVVRYKFTGRVYVMKIVSKENMKNEKKEEEVKTERDIHIHLNHHNIIKLYYTFKDKENLYFIYEYAPNGTLFDLLEYYNKLPLELGRYYAAELVNALKYLRLKGIQHQNLRPEKILISETYHLKLACFKCAKFESNKLIKEKTEISTGKNINFDSDLCSLGYIIYRFFSGKLSLSKHFSILDAISKSAYGIKLGFFDSVTNLCQ